LPCQSEKIAAERVIGDLTNLIKLFDF